MGAVRCVGRAVAPGIGAGQAPGTKAKRLRRTVTGVLAATTLGGVGLAWGADPHAAPYDPHVPIPPVWCPGNPPGAITASGYGGYCEGKSFPDGTRWNTYAIGVIWQPMRCIIPDGTAFPPLAPPGGCGGAW